MRGVKSVKLSDENKQNKKTETHTGRPKKAWPLVPLPANLACKRRSPGFAAAGHRQRPPRVPPAAAGAAPRFAAPCWKPRWDAARVSPPHAGERSPSLPPRVTLLRALQLLPRPVKWKENVFAKDKRCTPPAQSELRLFIVMPSIHFRVQHPECNCTCIFVKVLFL